MKCYVNHAMQFILMVCYAMSTDAPISGGMRQDRVSGAGLILNRMIYISIVVLMNVRKLIIVNGCARGSPEFSRVNPLIIRAY